MTVTATDGDGDPVTSDAVDISGVITFRDDGPSVTPALSTTPPAVVDESPPVAAPTINTDPIVKGDDPDLVGGQAIASGTTTLLSANAVFGADGPAAEGSLTYNLSIINPSSGLTLTDGTAINLVLLPSGVIVGVVQGAGPFAGQAAFAISIDTTTGVVTAELYLSLDHPNMADPNDTLTLAPGSLGATVTATDGDGDSVTSAVIDVAGRITFFDDGPSASDEAQQDVGEGASVNGQFDFVAGADGGGVTHINATALIFDPVTGFSQPVALDDGSIIVKADGTYVFTADASGSGVTSGTFTVTDGDGDPVVSGFSFNIVDANRPTAGSSTALLDDDGLTGPPAGNPASTIGDINANVGEVPTVNPSEAVFHGLLNFDFGGDGAGSINFASMHGDPGVVGTENVVYNWDAGTLTLTATTVGGTRPGTELFELVLDDATSGEYTLTLLDNVLHAAGGNETSAPNVALSFTVLDSDLSSANGTLNITFNDDGPSVAPVLNANAVAALDETGPAVAATLNTGAITKGDDPNVAGAASSPRRPRGGAVVDANAVFGADGPAADGGISYALSITNVDPGVTLTDGTTITMQLVGGVIVGVVDSGSVCGAGSLRHCDRFDHGCRDCRAISVARPSG